MILRKLLSFFPILKCHHTGWHKHHSILAAIYSLSIDKIGLKIKPIRRWFMSKDEEPAPDTFPLALLVYAVFLLAFAGMIILIKF